MLIKNTDATYCKIKDTKITGSTAYVTLLIYSSKPQTTPDSLGRTSRVFSFYLKDNHTGELLRLSNNNYWIDRCNNYNNNSTNVDINLYKEIILEIDISNLNKSLMQGNRWVRDCNILIIDQQSLNKAEVLWSSETLNLISKDIVLPTISDIRVTVNSNSVLHLTFIESFESQEDFNFINTNLKTIIDIKSAYTHSTIESYTINNEELQENNGLIELNSFEHSFNSPIIITIKIINNAGETLLSVDKFYNPNNTYNLYIKRGNTVKQIISVNKSNKSIISITKK